MTAGTMAAEMWFGASTIADVWAGSARLVTLDAVKPVLLRCKKVLSRIGRWDGNAGNEEPNPGEFVSQCRAFVRRR